MRDNQREPKWVQIGSSVTTPKSNTTRKEVFVDIDRYYLTVGFEVNYIDTAFKNNVLKLTGEGSDYGHAFFYVTKNDEVATFLSFGPNEAGKVGWFNKGPDKASANWGAWLKDGYLNDRPGTPDYEISEVTRLFRIKITEKEAKKIIIETEKMRMRIESGQQFYTVYVNDTCAETAKQILDAAGMETPDASGKVMVEDKVSLFKSVNPYMWHHNFKQAGYTEITYPKTGDGNIKSDGIHLKTKWTSELGTLDRLVKEGYVK